MKKTILLVTILTAINLLTFSASALEFSLDSPATTELNKSFQVSISSEEPLENYEVKIFVNKSTDSKSMSEIFYNGEWKKQYASSPYYFVFPETINFNIRIFEYATDTSICLYVKSSPIYKLCNPISISKEDKEELKETPDIEETEEGEKSKEVERKSEVFQDKRIEVIENPNDSPIILNSPVSGNTSKIVYTKEAKIRVFLNYLLLASSLVLLILIYKKRTPRDPYSEF